MIDQLKKEITSGGCMLLLGAGASYGSRDSSDRDLLMAEELSKLLCEEAGIAYEAGGLAKSYAVAQKRLGARLVGVLENRYRNTSPSLALQRLAEHVWPRIYTLNIDDATENALRKKSKQKLRVRGRFDAWAEIDGLFNNLDLIKLNGCVARSGDGYIFSPSEYASASNSPPEWYRQLGRDYLNYTFIFIGTRLEEPLFYQQIEYYKTAWSGSAGTPGRAYVITPSIGELDRELLNASNIIHIPGTLDEFVRWLDENIDNKRTPAQVARIKFPELAIPADDSDENADVSRLIKVSAIKRATFDRSTGRAREFYFGFKPTWDEIFDEVHAELGFYADFEDSLRKGGRLHVITGPAGSGKTTALMSAAAKLSREKANVYYLSEPVTRLETLVSKLEAVNSGPYFLFVDRASSVIDGIVKTLENPLIKNVVFVCGERVNVWRHRSEWLLSSFSPVVVRANEIGPSDAEKILGKLELFGPWSRVAKLTVAERTRELLEKSKRQLLIGLLELTTGYGFEKIIEDDFQKLDTEDAKLLVILVGMATIHGLGLSRDLCLAAFSCLGIRRHIDSLLTATQGIVNQVGPTLRARHPVYIDRLFDGRISLSLKDKAVRGLLSAMTRHERPVSANMSRGEGMIFKYTINHNFIKNFFHGRKVEIVKLFADYEKHFELDGLFYLQYGLSLRDQNEHEQALVKLKAAVDSWTMKQTEHAYAQQLLICALKDSREVAYRNLEVAKGILMRLDARHEVDDTDYPIVTLAEYHVRIAKKFEGDGAVKVVANEYLRELSHRQRRGRSNSRLEDAKKDIVRVASANSAIGSPDKPRRSSQRTRRTH